jgi:hypothetical protein
MLYALCSKLYALGEKIMPIRQQIFALIVGIAISIFIVEMVRRRKLREEYSWLWLLTGFGIVVLAVWYDLLVFITEMIGAVLPTTTLFVFGLLFLLLIALHYSVKISSLTDQVRKLAQKIAILQSELDERREESGKKHHESTKECNYSATDLHR